MLTMVALGFGEIAGALIQGILVDRIGPKKISILNVIEILLASSIVITFLYLDSYSNLAYLMTFAWGF